MVDLSNVRVAFLQLSDEDEDDTITWGEEAELILRDTSTESIHSVVTSNHTASDKAFPSHISFSGFKFSAIGAGHYSRGTDLLEQSPAWWAELLKKDEKFSLQPYSELAGVLRKSGYPYKADDILYEGRVRERRDACGYEGRDGEPRKARGQRDVTHCGWMLFLETVIGYGIGLYTFSVLWSIALFTGLGSAVFWLALRKRGWAYNWIDHTLASFVILLPLVALNTTHQKMTKRLPRPARVWFQFQAVVGWVLGLLVIAALSGLTRPS